MRHLAELLWGEDEAKPIAEAAPNIQLDGSMYKFFQAGSTAQSFAVPTGKVDTGYAMLAAMMWNSAPSIPVFTSPATTYVHKHMTIAGPGKPLLVDVPGVNGGTSSGQTVATLVADSSLPTVTWSALNSIQTGLIYLIALPPRFASANKQVVGYKGAHIHTGVPAADMQITFTAPFNGYYFAVQCMRSSVDIPGTTVPTINSAFNLDFNTTLGSWTSPGTFIIPKAIDKLKGSAMRIDYTYLTAGTTMTAGYLSGLTKNNHGFYLTIVGYQTTQ